jgi:hypothetical protein
MASGHRRVPHPKAGHMAAPTSDSASGQQSSCQPGAVHTWREADLCSSHSRAQKRTKVAVRPSHWRGSNLLPDPIVVAVGSPLTRWGAAPKVSFRSPLSVELVASTPLAERQAHPPLCLRNGVYECDLALDVQPDRLGTKLTNERAIRRLLIEAGDQLGRCALSCHPSHLGIQGLGGQREWRERRGSNPRPSA